MKTLTRPVARAVVSVLLLLPAACGGVQEAPPAARVSLRFNKDRVPIRGPIELTYRFEPLQEIGGDYRVFVHVLTADGTIMWNDDHDPQPATSAWRSGEPVEYTHTVFVPAFPYVGDATIRVGLYRGAERLPLETTAPDLVAAEERAYAVGTLRVLPEAESIFLIYGDGWHQEEYSPDDPSRSWQWTGKSASVTFRNPRQDLTVLLQFDSRADRFGDMPQQVTITAGNQMVDTFPADSLDPVLRRIPLPAGLLGADDMAQLRISVDRPFLPSKDQPGSADIRELGIRVYHFYVEPR